MLNADRAKTQESGGELDSDDAQGFRESACGVAPRLRDLSYIVVLSRHQPASRMIPSFAFVVRPWMCAKYADHMWEDLDGRQLGSSPFLSSNPGRNPLDKSSPDSCMHRMFTIRKQVGDTCGDTFLWTLVHFRAVCFLRFNSSKSIKIGVLCIWMRLRAASCKSVKIGLKSAGGEPGQEGRRNQARRQASIGLFRLETSGIRLLDGYLGFRVFGQRF